MPLEMKTPNITNNIRITTPKGRKVRIMMKSNWIKTAAMLSLSACMLAGGALSSFAAGTDGTSRYTAQVLDHQYSDCEGSDDAQMTVRFTSPYGETKDYVICAECGDVNGESGLTELDDTSSNFSDTYVHMGTLDNGVKVMTVSCISSGVSAMKGVTASVMLPREDIAGYDLYLINSDGTETELEPYGSEDWARIDVNMQDGAAVIRMVQQ